MRRLRLCLLPLLLLNLNLNLQAQDEPNIRTIQGWGQVIDPDQDCEVIVDDASLRLSFGPGVHALDAESTNGMNAPRVMRELKDDFAIQVTVEGELPLPELDGNRTRAYISGGLVLLQNEKNYIRLERASFTRGGTIWHYANFEQRVDAKRTRMGLFADFPLQNELPVQLRLEVEGEDVRALVRHEGDDWHELGKAKIYDRAEVLAGVSGVKTDAEEATVVFRDLKVNQDDFVSAVAKSESDIDMDAIRQMIATSTPAKQVWQQLMTDVLSFQREIEGIAQLSPERQAELLRRGKQLGTRKTPKQNAYLGPSLARRLAEAYLAADQKEHALRVYEEFIQELEQLRLASLKPSIETLRQAAEELSSDLGR